MSITNELNQIKNATYGKDVRGAIHDAIKSCYDDATVNHDNANMEVKLARGNYNTLNDRLNENESSSAANFADVKFYINQLFKEKMDVGGMISVNQINKVLGKIDESFLSDELLQIISGDAPVSMVPADGSITPVKNAYPTLIGEYATENLLDTSKVQDGYYVWYSDGTLYESETHCVTEFIPVVGGEKYESNVNEQTAFYDLNKNYISGVTGIGNGGVVIPANAVFMRMSINKNKLSTCMISKESLPLQYYPYSAKLSPLLVKGYHQYIPSVTEKVKIIGTKIKFVGNVTLFDSVRRVYIRLSGEYDLRNSGDCLVLNVINGLTKVVNFHSTIHSLDANYIVLFVEYQGEYLSSIFDDRHVVDLENRRNIYVSKYKNADYQTIAEAINDCKSASANYYYNIIIDNGIYLESLDLTGVNNINLIGVNKNTCVIQNQNANYYKCPLNTNGAGYFANLTFISSSEYDDGVEPRSYAMHYEGDGDGLCEFYNCIFKSDNNSAVGIGMRKNETLILNQCEIIKTDVIPTGMGAFYCHSAQFNGHSNQHIVVKNCEITSQTGAFLTIDDSNTLDGIGEFGNVGGEMDVTFINNNFYSGTYGRSDSGVVLRGAAPINDNCFIGSVVLNKKSYGNNVSMLNR